MRSEEDPSARPPLVTGICPLLRRQANCAAVGALREPSARALPTPRTADRVAAVCVRTQRTVSLLAACCRFDKRRHFSSNALNERSISLPSPSPSPLPSFLVSTDPPLVLFIRHLSHAVSRWRRVCRPAPPPSRDDCPTSLKFLIKMFFRDAKGVRSAPFAAATTLILLRRTERCLDDRDDAGLIGNLESATAVIGD
uniref:Uncharacterized protein n=1 Tax=Plectus sambesii TaxID=2011161 RepID=A0A914V848_9BILA